MNTIYFLCLTCDNILCFTAFSCRYIILPKAIWRLLTSNIQLLRMTMRLHSLMRLQLCPVMMPSIFHLFSLSLYPLLTWRTHPKTQLLVSLSSKMASSKALKFYFCVLNTGEVVSTQGFECCDPLNEVIQWWLPLKIPRVVFLLRCLCPVLLTMYNEFSSNLCYKLKTVNDTCLFYDDHCFPQKRAERKMSLLSTCAFHTFHGLAFFHYLIISVVILA